MWLNRMRFSSENNKINKKDETNVRNDKFHVTPGLLDAHSCWLFRTWGCPDQPTLPWGMGGVRGDRFGGSQFWGQKKKIAPKIEGNPASGGTPTQLLGRRFNRPPPPTTKL